MNHTTSHIYMMQYVCLLGAENELNIIQAVAPQWMRMMIV
jgi:hypothetical protein